MLRRGLPRDLRRAALLLILPASVVTGACGESNTLTGEWMATSDNAEGTAFVFHEDGSALWLLPDTFHIRYEADFGPTPHTLDLSGFDRGPLEDYLLYCIFELEGDSALRLDCEPGVDSQRGAAIRPGEFGAEQTQTFERRRG